MNTFKKYFFFLTLSLGLVWTGCVDNEFDEPENTLTIDDDDVMSISDVLDMLGDSTTIDFTEDNLGESPVYVRGTVNADDASGNFFKVISFQDETDALSVIPDRNELNAEFQIGKTIYIKLQGLTLTFDAGLPRLGYGIVASRLQRIPDILVNDFLFAGGPGEEIVPEVITIADFLQNPNAYYNKLIQLDSVEFSLAFAGQTYADADNSEGPQSINAIIQDCADNEVILRNSGFADFANELIPSERGTLMAIASVFNDDLQLFIRDLNDVQFSAARCDGSGTQAGEEITIQSIQDRWYQFGADKAENGFITGTVISDRNVGQVNSRNIILQNGEDGIVVRFTGDHSYDLGDELKITVSGREVSEFRGLLQLNEIPLFNAEVTGSGELPTAKEMTVSEILQDNNTFESTRVLIKNATLSGGSTFSGTVRVNDGTDEIIIFTFDDSEYANEPVPLGNVDVTGIVSQFDETVQLVINGVGDIEGGTVDPGNEDRITVQSIQDKFYNEGASSADVGYIEGVVISDRNTGQVNGQNIFFQDGDYGILVRFTGDHNFNLGQRLRISVTGAELSEFRELLQINNVPLANASVIGSENLPEPVELTVNDILQNNNRYESTRVLVKGAMLSGSATFAGNITVDDGSGEIVIFTFNTTSYANDAVPTGIVDVTAIVTQFNETVQLLLNDPEAEIEGGTVDPGGDEVNTGFENYNDDEPIDKEGWMTIATKGTRTWFSSSFSGDRFAECEAWQDSNPETEAWLITPTINTDEKSIFSFQSAKAFWKHQGLSVWISADFTDFADANWIELDQAVLADDSFDDFDLIDSGDIDLKDYLSGNVRVGFLYQGTSAQNTTKSRIDNVMLK